MTDALMFLAAGSTFGLAGGFSPGPTTTVVVSQTLRFGVLDGIKVAIAPALTDAPIILVAVLLVGQLARFEPVLGIISLLGGVFLLYLAFESFRVRGIEIDETQVEPRSISKGFMANLLNPHPYLFWFVVGAPKLIEAAEITWMTAVAFIAGLYACLIGAKILVAFLVGRSRGFLRSRGYIYVNRVLGVVLAVFSIFFFRDGMRFLSLS
ncbi:MAG: LysE family translocator [Planctomycetes bacterium]|nr:LysE family translocator [Planctomycetota bacterium]